MKYTNLKHPFGETLNILKFSEENGDIFVREEFDNLFNHPEIQDRKVVILSVIGTFKGGKSLFLDYCLRFLYANYPSLNNPNKKSHLIFKKDENWMGEPDEPLKGFSWRSGMERDTIGIIMWSDVFLHTMDRTGEKIAIFVMDTQGLFDSNSSSADNSKIFSLSTLTSSIQVLNIMKQIQEDQLQYLQIATEFTKFSIIDSGASLGKPFQNLIFLIRDWDNVDEYDYGSTGGQAYINKVLKIDESKNADIRSVREMIYVSFEEIKCSLLPYPGTSVAGRKKFDGSWSAMSDDFKTGLKSTIEYILMPENMILKKINSKEITVREIAKNMYSYIKYFQSMKIARPFDLYKLTFENHMTILVEKCIDEYKSEMLTSISILNAENIFIIHSMFKNKAIDMYLAERKMESKQHEEKYKTELLNGINKVFTIYTNLIHRRVKGIQAEKPSKHGTNKNKPTIGENDNDEEFRKHSLMVEARELADRKKTKELEEEIRQSEDFKICMRSFTCPLLMGFYTIIQYSYFIINNDDADSCASNSFLKQCQLN